MNTVDLRLSRRLTALETGTLRSDSRYLDGTCTAAEGSGANHALRGGAVSDGSGFPAANGQFWYFSGAGADRDMALWTGKGSEDLYFQTFDANGAGQGWNAIWHGGNDGSGSGLDADTLDGLEAAQMLPVQLYSFTNGCLIATDIQDDESAMIALTLRGNGYATGQPVFVMVDTYQYQAGSQFINSHGLSAGYEFNIDIFRYNGYVHFWFAQPQNYTSILATVDCTNASARYNRITSISNAAKPSSGVTWSVTVLPRRIWNSGKDGVINKDRPWVTLDSPSTGSNTNEQAAGISIGESGQGSASIHMTYTGDGSGHLGMGAISSAVPGNEALQFHYLDRNVRAMGNIYPYTNDTGYLGTSTNAWAGAYMSPATTSTYNTLRRNNSTNQILYYSSSLQFKDNVRELSDEGIDPDLIYNIRPKVFDEKADEKRLTDTGNIIGFIAEEVEAACPAIVFYGEDGKVRSYSEDAMVALVVGAMGKLRDRVAVLEKAAGLKEVPVPALDMKMTSGDGLCTLVDRTQ